jgi:hypothetical protein
MVQNAGELAGDAPGLSALPTVGGKTAKYYRSGDDKRCPREPLPYIGAADILLSRRDGVIGVWLQRLASLPDGKTWSCCPLLLFSYPFAGTITRVDFMACFQPYAGGAYGGRSYFGPLAIEVLDQDG